MLPTIYSTFSHSDTYEVDDIVMHIQDSIRACKKIKQYRENIPVD